mgnify:FL=1
MRQLDLDALKDPRPIHEEQFQPRKIPNGTVTEFEDRREREKKFLKDHRLYSDNKKEVHDRQKLFYILEQFFEHSRTHPDKMSEAQGHMKTFFSDPENTFFFDKNKIQ